MEDPGGQPGQEEMLNYINTSSHKVNLKAALDYHSVREPDMELVSSEGRKLYGHRSVLGIFSPMLADICAGTPCCQKTSIMFPDTTSEVLSHLLNVLYTGSTETSSDKVQLLCGANGVFATAKLLGIDIKADQKVIEVVDRTEGGGHAAPFTRRITEDSLGAGEGHEEAEEEEEETIVVEGEQAETMEITPQIPMFDLGHFLYQPPYQYQEGDQSDLAEEEPVAPPSPQENEDFYICKLPSCQTMIQFENCGARSKILNHYTSHFQRELEQAYGHLLSEDMQCTLCQKDLRNFIKSKVWIHIGVTHDKTNDILVKKGIEPIRVNIRMNKRKVSDAFREESSPRFDENLAQPPPPRMVEYPALPPGTTFKPNTCKLCGQVTQNRKRLLKHYCTKHYIDRLSSMEFSFIEKNRCTICFKDFIGAKKSSKVIHIGLEHKMIYDILEKEFGVDGYLKHDSSTPLQPPPLKKMKPDPTFRPIAPKLDLSSPSSGVQFVSPHIQHNMPRVEATMSERMKEIQDLGNTCHVCGKQFDLFRSMLLPHYCGHFYKEIAQGHEDYFTEVNCKLCGATATKRKSRIIHLGVKHELVLPYIEDTLRSKNIIPALEEEQQGEEEEEVEDQQDEFVIDESELKSETGEVTEVTDEMMEEVEEVEEEEEEEETEVAPDVQEYNEGTEDEMSYQHNGEIEEEQVVTPIRIKTISLKKLKEEEGDSETDASMDGITTIGKIVKKEDPDSSVTDAGVKPQNKEVWVTPARSKSEMLSKIATQQNNIDNQNKSLHLDHVFNDIQADPVEEEEEEDDEFEEVTAENLGLVCRFCSVTETSDYELLTHYCSHFDSELKEISGRMIDEDHKCVECNKMLGNNKRRLYHFGVKHLKVIPLINKKLRMIKKSEAVDDSADMTEEDDFEITYDNQPHKVVENDHRNSNKSQSFQNADAFAFHRKDQDLLKVHVGEENCEEKSEGRGSSPFENNTKATESKLSNSVSSPSQQPASYVCFKCGAKRRGLKELYGHYSLQHFSKELMEEFGVQKKCNMDDCGRNLENGTAWISHLGQEHPEVLEKHIPEKQWHSQGQNHQDREEEMEEENIPVVFKCPLKCSISFSDKPELLNHFKSIHGFSNEIIQKVLKAHPRLNSLSEGPQAKRVEA